MDLSPDDLARAVDRGILTQGQAEALWASLVARPAPPPGPPPGAPPPARPRFDAVHVAWYFGALIVLGAMGWFMTSAWEEFGGWGLLLISILYAGAFLAAGRSLWGREGLRTPGGLLITLAVGMTPLATYGLQRALGLWPSTDPGDYAGFHEWIKGGWFVMELATVAAALLALRSYKFPFLTAPLAFTLWYVSMDLAPLLHASWNQRCAISALVGLAIIVAAFLVDRRTREDFGFWLYLFGLLALWGGLVAVQGGTALGRFLFLLVNLLLIATSLLLRRRVFMVFGALGVTGYLGYLAHDVFKDSLLFPVVLTLVGLGIIAVGVHVHQRSERYQAALRQLVPASVRAWLPPDRA